jgi:hypothetical protein|tara:strand:+ start:642 stop:758 length:117 start_codon:yes stop_codon:yes gene_type:complete
MEKSISNFLRNGENGLNYELERRPSEASSSYGTHNELV